MNLFGSTPGRQIAKVLPQNTVNTVKPVISSQLPKIEEAPSR